MSEGENPIAEAVPTTPAPSEPTTETADRYEGMIDLDAPDEPELSEPSASEVEEPADPEAEPVAEVDGDGQPPAPEFATIEIDGKEYNVPPELKDGYLRNADYTRKTQEVAEQRRQVEAVKAEAEALFTASNEFIEARAKLVNADAMLEQYAKVDWDAYEQQLPLDAQSDWRKYQLLREERANLAQNLSTQWNQRSEQQRIETQQRLQETANFAKKEIPGWSPEIDAKMTDFALGQGFTQQQLEQTLNPTMYKMLHLAWIGQQTLTRTQSAPKPQAQTTALKTVSAKASPAVRKDLADMSMDEYVKARPYKR